MTSDVQQRSRFQSVNTLGWDLRSNMLSSCLKTMRSVRPIRSCRDFCHVNVLSEGTRTKTWNNSLTKEKWFTNYKHRLFWSCSHSREQNRSPNPESFVMIRCATFVEHNSVIVWFLTDINNGKTLQLHEELNMSALELWYVKQWRNQGFLLTKL